MLNPFAYAKVVESFAVRYPTGVKSAGFRSQFEAFLVFSHTDKFWFNEIVCLWMTIYIYYDTSEFFVVSIIFLQTFLENLHINNLS